MPISASGSIFPDIDKENCTLVVPEWSALLYKMAMGWSDFSKIETVQTGDLSLLTVDDDRYLPGSVRPNGAPNVFLTENGKLTVRGSNAFNMNEVTMNMKIGKPDEWHWGYDKDGNYVKLYSPILSGSCLYNDESALTAQSARLGIKSTGATWGFITLPFDANIADITPMVEGDANNYIWKTYDGERRALAGTGGNWKEVTGTLKAGRGYIYQSQNNDSIYVKAIASSLGNMLGNADITIPLSTYSASDAEDESWNFIGNPYPTYFNTRYIGFSAPITVWNGNGYEAISLTDDDYTLAPYQAFFVQKQNTTDYIKFLADGRVTESTQSSSTSYAMRCAVATSARSIVNLYIEGAGYKDKSRIVFNENASMDYELNCDATKFMDEGSNVPQLYSIDYKGRQYAINERPEGAGSVNLGIVIPEAGQYTISANKLNLPKEVYLIDTKENTVTELGSAAYTFYSEAATSDSRFLLSFDGSVTGIAETGMSASAQVVVTGNGIIVTNAMGQSIEAYTMEGKRIYSAVARRQQETVTMDRGAYIVKVGDKSMKTIIK